MRKDPDLYRVVEESQFVDAAIYRNYYTEFAKGYRAALANAESRGELRPGKGDNHTEVRAWMLMGIAVFLGQRYGLWEPKASLDTVVDTAADMLMQGMFTQAGGAK